MDQTDDIDDDQLNALLFTDSDDEKPVNSARLSRQASNVKPSPSRQISAGSRRSSLSDNATPKPVVAPKSANGVSALDEDLFGGLAGPKVVNPVNVVTDSKPTRKPRKKKKVGKELSSKTAAEPAISDTSSRDEALRILAQEEAEAETSLNMLLGRSDKKEQKPDQVPESNPKPVNSDFSSDDDFLAGLDDKPDPIHNRSSSSSSGTKSGRMQLPANGSHSETRTNDSKIPLSNQLQAKHNASPSAEIETGYVPTANNTQRAIPLQARAGRRARTSATNKIEDSPVRSTQSDRPVELPTPTMNEIMIQPQQQEITVTQSSKFPAPAITETVSKSLNAPNLTESAEFSTQSRSANSVLQPALITKSASMVLSEPSPNGTSTVPSFQTASIWDSIEPLRSDQESINPGRNTIVSQIQEAATANQIAQFNSDLSRAKRTIKELESEVEGLKVQLKAAAADHQEQLLAHTKATNEREVQIRIEEERKIKAAIEHINIIQQASIATKERLQQEAIDSLKRMHEMEIAAIKRQHGDEHKIISMSEAVSRSAVTVEGIQREVREEITRADQQRRSDADAREKVLIERERKLQEEIKRHTNVIATFESLRREHDAERGRLHQEEVRLEALQEFLMSESSSLKAQIANERAALQEEKRTFDRAVKDWKLEVAANQAEIAFLRDKAQAKANEAQAAESAGQRAFAQAHQMVISEGEIIRRDREIAAKLRTEMEQEKQKTEQVSANLVEQRRQLSARMADIQKFGEKIRSQSEAVALAYRQAQSDIAESKRIKQEVEQEKVKIKSERTTIEELRTFVEEERRRMETDRLEIVRQRQRMILERRDPTVSSNAKTLNFKEIKNQQSIPAVKPILNNENRLLKPIPSSNTNIEKEVKAETIRLSAEQERELFQLRMKAKVAADYATNEKKIIRPI